VYLYHNLDSGFRAKLDLDAAGLITSYQGVWQSVGHSAGNSMNNTPSTTFAGALLAEHTSQELGDHAADVEWLVGCWFAVVHDYDEDGTVRVGSGEWWFNWILEGRAIQDVWIVPPRDLRKAPAKRTPPTIDTARLYAPIASRTGCGASCGSIRYRALGTSFLDVAQATELYSKGLWTDGQFVGASTTSLPRTLFGVERASARTVYGERRRNSSSRELFDVHDRSPHIAPWKMSGFCPVMGIRL
jgi:hypothetical protein